ncbi:MAG: hypothetical protein K6A36_04975 [Paludibacteraceae bacterium]|nr:hypothetical protein [Paludibacteraceae bacterium]
MKYFAFRIFDQKADVLEEELKIGHLRQGWGADPELNLREGKNAQKDKGARKNFPIKNKVHENDFLFVLNMPDMNYVTLAQATTDFSKGYVYDERSLEFHDLGHIFPAKWLARIPKKEYYKAIRASRFCRRRFYELKNHEKELSELIVKYYKF